MTEQKCPVCGKKHLVSDETSGELYCGKCGYVFPDKLENDDTAYDQSKTRDQIGLSTIIDPKNKDVTGKPLSPNVINSMERLRKWDSISKTSSSSDKNLKKALFEMKNLQIKLRLSNAIFENSVILYKKLLKTKPKGRPIKEMVIGCLYIECKNTETPRTLDDIACQINVKPKSAGRTYRWIVHEMNLKTMPSDPVKIISNMANIAQVSEKSKRKAIEFFNTAKTANLSQKNPLGIVGALLYLACVSTGESKSQKEIAKASGISTLTLRNRCRDIRKMIKM